LPDHDRGRVAEGLSETAVLNQPAEDALVVAKEEEATACGKGHGGNEPISLKCSESHDCLNWKTRLFGMRYSSKNKDERWLLCYGGTTTPWGQILSILWWLSELGSIGVYGSSPLAAGIHCGIQDPEAVFSYIVIERTPLCVRIPSLPTVILRIQTCLSPSIRSSAWLAELSLLQVRSQYQAL
jgi:hypothetical protein